MRAGLIVGTGYSLKAQLELLPRFDGLVFIPNNVYHDLPHSHVWLACDPSWHDFYGPVHLPYTDQWHWDEVICAAGGYKFTQGVWKDGLVLDGTNRISFNHCSAAQLLNLAANQYRCDTIVLVGHDFHYKAPQRHYFDDLSDVPGEYPEELRKWSKFKKSTGRDLVEDYRYIARDLKAAGIDAVNCTPGSQLPWFKRAGLQEFLI